MLPSKEILEQVSLIITIISGLLKLLPLFIKRLSFLRRPSIAYSLSAVALFSLGLFFGYLRYERNWVLADKVQGRPYDFTEQQGNQKYWCQWAMDPQDTSALKRAGLKIYKVFTDVGDFIYEGKGRAKVGYLAANDSHHAGEPQGRLAVAIYDYDLDRLPKSSTAHLTLEISRDTPEFPPQISIDINHDSGRGGHGTIDVNDHSTVYTFTFDSGWLSRQNYIYLTPYFREPPHGRSKLLYLEKLDIAVY